MREMKDSGIDFIGKIPKNWLVSRVKFYCTMNSGDNITAQDIETEGRYPVYGGNGLRGYFSKYNFDGKYILIGRQGALAGNVHRVSDKFWSTDHAVVTNVFESADLSFFYYLFIAMNLNQYAFDTAAQPGLAVSKIMGLSIAIPLVIKEQYRVAKFLDLRCYEINAFIADIQKQVDILEQYKQSVITEVVTKGLNTNVEMKDSGIEWIGKIPSHWHIHPVYYYFAERKKKNVRGKENNLLSLSYGRVIRKDINSNGGLLPENFNTYNIVEDGDIIIRPTDLQNDKRSLRTGLVKEHGIITSAYIDLMSIRHIDTRYFHYLLHSYDVMKVFYNMGNGVRQGLNFSEFSRLMVFEPSYKEQVQIADYLDEKIQNIDALIDTKKQQLIVIETYKKSVIYEYVTGKREVM